MAVLASFRGRLAIYALLCAVPLLILTALQLHSDTQRKFEVAVNATSSLAETTRNRIEQDLASAELIATALGAMVRPGAQPECGTTLPAVLAAAGPRVTNIILVSAGGAVQCSARPMSGPQTLVGDRPHMRRALELRRPTVSGFVIGRVSGQRSVQIVVPVLDAAGAVSAFVVVGLTADNLLAGISLDTSLQSSLTLFDRDGLLISTAPDVKETSLGDPFIGQQVFSRREEASNAPIEIEGLDGIARLSVARPVRFDGETIGWVVSGAGAARLQTVVGERLRRDIAVVLLLTGLVLSVGMLAARPIVLGRHRGVLRVAAQVAAGDHSSRVPLRHSDDLTPVETAINRMLDVLERHAAEMTERESRFRLLFEHNLDAVLETLPNGAVSKANPAACALLQHDCTTIKRLTRDTLVDASDPRLGPLLEERRATGRASGELRFRRADGTTFEAEVASSVYRDVHDQDVTCIVFRDITQRLQAQAKLVELNEQLEERVRQRTRELQHSNAELLAFADSVSHDLRAPVARIQAFGRELQERGLVCDASGRHYLERMLAAAGRMDALIEGLLELSQINRVPLRVTALDLTALAEEAVQECRDANPGRLVNVQVDRGLAASGDARLVHSVFANLIRNAWKFTSTRPQALVAVESGGTLPGGGQIICVRDNGVGFAEAHAAHLFEPFRRLHRDDEFPGLGIGLATVRRIVHRHGGDVWAKAVPGEGAMFYFSLPSREFALESAADASHVWGST